MVSVTPHPLTLSHPPPWFRAGWLVVAVRLGLFMLCNSYTLAGGSACWLSLVLVRLGLTKIGWAFLFGFSSGWLEFARPGRGGFGAAWNSLILGWIS